MGRGCITGAIHGPVSFVSGILISATLTSDGHWPTYKSARALIISNHLSVLASLDYSTYNNPSIIMKFQVALVFALFAIFSVFAAETREQARDKRGVLAAYPYAYSYPYAAYAPAASYAYAPTAAYVAAPAAYRASYVAAPAAYAAYPAYY
ncbi:uncharacterized protein [Bemisia tabaci]|uniref:uncharacterized protein n=1 Tax=Bemisia tabaci TaxID=7038 RepID=UPI003B27FFAB